MLKYASPLLCFIVFLGSCQKAKKESYTIDEIYRIHQQIDSLEVDSVYHYLNMVKELLRKKSFLPDSLRAENNYLLGQHFQKLEVMDSAAIYYHNATDFVEDSIYLERQGHYFRDAWNAYSNLGRFGECFTITEKFKSLLKTDRQFRSLSWALNWEQNTYLMMGEYSKALKVNNHQIQLAKKHDSLNIPMVLTTRADLLYYYLNDKEGAFKILDKLLEQEEQLNNSFKRQINGTYGVYQYYEGNYKMAAYYYKRAVKAARLDTLNADYINDLANTYNNTAEVLIDLKQYDKARKYLDSVRFLGINNLARNKQKSLLKYELRLATTTNKNINLVTGIMDSIYAHQDKAYRDKFNIELVALKKSIENEKSLLKSNQDIEISNLKLKSRFWLALISAALLILVGFLLYQRRKFKFEKKSLQNQQRLLRSQMNPHFTFNSIYAIQNQIKKDPEKGVKYLPKFSRLLRLILENSMSDYVLLEKEIESLNKYIEFQSLQSAIPFKHRIVFKNMEEDEFIFIPPMLLQPFVENSIMHGFSGIDYTGRIDIQFELKGKFLECIIEDNGRGFASEKVPYKHSASVNLISDFLKKATRKEVEITDKKHFDSGKNGIIVRLLIPYKLTEND